MYHYLYWLLVAHRFSAADDEFVGLVLSKTLSRQKGTKSTLPDQRPQPPTSAHCFVGLALQWRDSGLWRRLLWHQHLDAHVEHQSQRYSCAAAVVTADQSTLVHIDVPRSGPEPTIVWSVAILRDTTVVSGDSLGNTTFWSGK